MTDQMAAEEFGDCSNHGECEAVCPEGDFHRRDRTHAPRVHQVLLLTVDPLLPLPDPQGAVPSGTDQGFAVGGKGY